MRVLRKLQNKILGTRPTRTAKKALLPSGKPKIGFLILGVAVTIAVMVTLTLVNLKLIRDQVGASKRPVRESTLKNFGTIIPECAVVDSKPENKKRHSATEVTFYKQLKYEDDGKNIHDKTSHKAKTGEMDSKSSIKDTNRQDPKTAKEETSFSVPALSGTSSPRDDETNTNLPLTTRGSKIYSVQVGVFSYPRVAQEWAEKWRSRGYPTILRPIARPNTGIQYRLFVGEFNSEKKADEFAKQFKAKEGVTGLTLVIKD